MGLDALELLEAPVELLEGLQRQPRMVVVPCKEGLEELNIRELESCSNFLESLKWRLLIGAQRQETAIRRRGGGH